MQVVVLGRRHLFYDPARTSLPAPLGRRRQSAGSAVRSMGSGARGLSLDPGSATWGYVTSLFCGSVSPV